MVPRSVLVGRTDLLEEFFDDFPENQGGSLVIECDAPAVLFIAGKVLEMCLTEIRMVLVLVPASVKARIRVGIVDTEPIVRVLPVPFDGQFRGFRPCRRVKAGWFEYCLQLLSLDVVWHVLDRRDLWDTIKDVSLQLGVKVRVRVTTGMRD